MQSHASTRTHFLSSLQGLLGFLATLETLRELSTIRYRYGRDHHQVGEGSSIITQRMDGWIIE